MTDKQAMERKDKCLADIRNYMKQPHNLETVDHRLADYIDDCIREDIDAANLYELLGIRRFLRMWDTYPFDAKKVKRVLRAYEGQWDERGYIQGSGGLLFSGMKGRTHYRLTPLQVFELSAPFGFMRSEEDWRRVVTECDYFIPRKSSKTTLAAFFQFWFFMFEDSNCEGYCVANSQEQSKILYRLTYDLIHQLDPQEKRIRFTATETNWRTGQPREAKMAALSAGGKTKDGLFAQLVCADEYGSAGYVKDHSDMANLLQVVEGSMGPRREPMTVITTTAGRVNNGPYQMKLTGIKEELLKELDTPLDGLPHPLSIDWQFALLCCPDQWEESDEDLQRPEVWRKVNRHIGVTIQEDFYEREWKKMLMDEEKKKEQITKLFNVFQTERVKTWITPDQVMKLQQQRKIDDLSADNGWVCFVGMDFSKGDDLNAQSYLCVNTQTGEMFADMDAWITEETLNSNQNRTLYDLWYRQGHLHVSPGATIDENLPLTRLMQIADRVTIMRIGYDAYDAQRFVNAIKAWIFSSGENPDNYVRPVRQTFATYNSAVQEIDYLVKNDPPILHFSSNPMWAWEFGNTILMESGDGMGNVKPVKSGAANGKVDNVQCLASAVILYDQTEGQAE